MNRINSEIVCHCLGITRQTIEAAVVCTGAETPAEVKQLTEAGSACRACRVRICGVIRSLQQDAENEHESQTVPAA